MLGPGKFSDFDDTAGGDGENGQGQADLDMGALESKFASKNWKDRSDCLVAVAAKVRSGFKGCKEEEVMRYVLEGVDDSNVIVQEKGIEAAVCFIENASEHSMKEISPQLSARLVYKGLVQAKCRGKAQRALLQMCKLHSNVVVTELMAAASSKQPKIAAAAVESLRIYLQSEGLPTFDKALLKEIISLSVQLFDSTVTSVRAEALPIALSIFKVFGSSLREKYQNLRPAQQKEIDDALAQMEKSSVEIKENEDPADTTGRDQNLGQGSDVKAMEDQPVQTLPELDLWEISDPVNVLKQIPEDWCQQVTSEPKWQIRLEKLNTLMELSKVPRIAPGDYGEIVKTLLKLFNDSMVLVVSTAATCISNLAGGLRKSFSPYARLCIGPLLDHFRDKDRRVTEALHAAFLSLYPSSLCADDVLDEISKVLEPKISIKAKIEAVKLLQVLVERRKADDLSLWVKHLVEVIGKATNDNASEVRDAAKASMSCLASAAAVENLHIPMEILDEKLRARLESRQNEETAESSTSQRTKSVPSSPARNSPSVKTRSKPRLLTLEDDAGNPKEVIGRAKSSPKLSPAKGHGREATKVEATPLGSKARESSNAVKKAKDTASSTSVTALKDEELESFAKEAINTKYPNMLERLETGAWKDKLEALTELENVTKIEEFMGQENIAQALLRLLTAMFIDRKETNMQVLAKVFQIAADLFLKRSLQSMNLIESYIPVLVDKFSDAKLKQVVTDCLLNFGEAINPKQVLDAVIDQVSQHKNPKVHSEALAFCQVYCLEFGFSVLDPKMLLGFIKNMLTSPNPTVKKSSIEILKTMRIHLGSDIRNFLTDVKPALLTVIDEAFSSIPELQEAPMSTTAAPRRVCKASGKEKELLTDDASFKATPLATIVHKSLEGLSNSNWKDRHSSLIAIEDALKKAKPLGHQGPYVDVNGGEFWTQLKARLRDSNKNIVMLSISLLSQLTEAIGPNMEKVNKIVLPSLFPLIGDNKKVVRDAVLECMKTLSKNLSPDIIVRHAHFALSVEAPAGREDATRWMADFLQNMDKKTDLDLSSLLPPIIDSLQHRNAEIRAAAERCLVPIISLNGTETLEKIIRDQKPALAETLQAVCSRAAQEANEEGSSSHAAGHHLQDRPPHRSSPSSPDPQDSNGRVLSAHRPPSPQLSSSMRSPIQDRRDGNVRSSLLSRNISSAKFREKDSETRNSRKSLSLSRPSTATSMVRKSILKPDAMENISSSQGSAASAPSNLNQRIFRRTNQKDLREKRHGKFKWILDNAKEVESLVQAMSEQMFQCIDSEIHSKLFSKEFKKQVEGMRIMGNSFQIEAEEVIDNLDMILKFCSLRLVGKGNNTIVVLAVLDLLRNLFDFLTKENYCLSDYEAQMCLPCLMEEVGANNENVRKQIREALLILVALYPASKFFNLLLDTLLHTRNQRAKAECLSVACYMVQEKGLDEVTSNPGKVISTIGTFVSERDASVRNSAIEFIIAVYSMIGEKVWKHLSKLEIKDKDLIDTKLNKMKLCRGSMKEPSPSNYPHERLPRHESDSESPLTVKEHGFAVRSSMEMKSHSLHGDKNVSVHKPMVDLISVDPFKPSRSAHGERRFESAEKSLFCDQNMHNMICSLIDDIRASSTAREQAAAVLQLCDIIDSIKTRGDADEVLAHVDIIVDTLITLVGESIATGGTWDDTDTRKGVTDALRSLHYLLSSVPTAAKTVSDRVLSRLMEELLWTLHDPHLHDDEMMEQVVRSMNELVVDVLHFARPNAVFTILINFLYDQAPLSGLREPTLDFIDGVLRCLLEMTRRISTFLDDMNIDVLLRDIHKFLTAHPPSQYKGKEFRPLRLLKMILNELVKLKGTAIKNHLTLIPVHSNPILCSYLELVFKQQGAKMTKESSESFSRVHSIFDQIVSKDSSVARSGFESLHDYIQENDDFDLDDYMSDRPADFRVHVKRGLAKIHARVESKHGSCCEQQDDSSQDETSMETSAAEEKKHLTCFKGPSATSPLIQKFHQLRSLLANQSPREENTSGEMMESPPPSAHVETPGSELHKRSSFLSLQERLAKLKLEKSLEPSP